MENAKTYIADNIARINERIACAATASGRTPEDIKLVCVSKNFPPETVRIALECGVNCLGENRVQEFLDKRKHVTAGEWHLIGHLQTNKVKDIVGKVSLIQSVDSVRLLEELERRSDEADIISRILLQVNTSGEESKFGAPPDEIDKLLEKVHSLKRLKVCGLMTIAPLCNDKIATRLHFVNTHRLYIDMKQKKYDNVDMEYLSMGMSGDFEDAIRHGANMVRIGNGIFGNR